MISAGPSVHHVPRVDVARSRARTNEPRRVCVKEIDDRHWTRTREVVLTHLEEGSDDGKDDNGEDGHDNAVTKTL